MAEQKTPDFTQLMKTAQEMQKNMQKVHEELANTEVTGEAGGGILKIVMNGRHDVKRVNIENSVLMDVKDSGSNNISADGKAVLEDLIAAAINDAVRKVEKTSREKIAEITKKMGLPEGSLPTE